MNNKLVVVITHLNRSEVLPIPHAVRRKLTITGGAPKDLPSQTVSHFPKSIIIDIPDDIIGVINDYKNQLNNSDDKQDTENNDDESHVGSTVRPTDDPNTLFKISVTITHKLTEQDIKYITRNRASIKEIK